MLFREEIFQNLQNLENTKRRNEEIENELINAEKKFNAINQNIKEIQTKLFGLKSITKL